MHSTYSDGYRLNDLQFRSRQGQETILQIIQHGSWAHLAANVKTTHLHPVPGIRIIAPILAHSVYMHVLKPYLPCTTQISHSVSVCVSITTTTELHDY